MDDLMAEMSSGNRSIITDHERRLAIAFEKSQLPADIRFPQEGEVYEAKVDVEIGYLTHYHVPFTGGATFLFPRGERLQITSVTSERPIGVYAKALRYEELHATIVSDEERSRPEYAGYSLYVKTVQFDRNFQLVQDPETER
jgi:hypothetical protein